MCFPGPGLPALHGGGGGVGGGGLPHPAAAPVRPGVHRPGAEQPLLPPLRLPHPALTDL